MIRHLIVLFLLIAVVGCNEIKQQTDLAKISTDFETGAYKEAKDKLSIFLTENDKSLSGWILMGHTQEELEEDSLANVAYQKALSIDTKSVEAITGLGILARKNKRYKEAIKHYQKAIEIDPEYAQAYSSLSVISIIEKNYSDAVRYGMESYKLDPTDPTIMANLAVAYHVEGDTISRNKFLNEAEKNGYKNIDKLKEIVADGANYTFE